ncbi:MAG TPA: tetratricopeptide repeat protein [Pyrinomonadaceae bacterium]|nr:tetratricopeptide repeat protein [Pyrinomonadaceae bacterium]
MKLLILSLVIFTSGWLACPAFAQGGPMDGARGGSNGGPHTLYGDVKVDESKAAGVNRLSYDIILYNLSRVPVGRQTVTSSGRYRFNNLPSAIYDLVVESENVEITRIRVELVSPLGVDQRQDISLELRPSVNSSAKPASVSAEDYYKRVPANQKLFDKAQVATDNKKYAEAVTLFNELLSNDPKDYQAWTELGTVYLIDQKATEAEKAYGKAIDARPKFFLALMNLGRLRIMQKNFEGAILPLSAAVEVKPSSADANYYLGEAYLQTKKGSKAVGYLNEAIKLDPIGRADAHLRLATLYNAAGMKDKAALEYEEFLKKKPNYPDAKKLREYVEANKPKS